jgi:hypothetical protein
VWYPHTHTHTQTERERGREGEREREREREREGVKGGAYVLDPQIKLLLYTCNCTTLQLMSVDTLRLATTRCWK